MRLPVEASAPEEPADAAANELGIRSENGQSAHAAQAWVRAMASRNGAGAEPPETPGRGLLPNRILKAADLVPTVFHEEWWMDAATEGSYAIAEVSANGRLAGRLPFTMRTRLGIRGIWTPPFTYFLGPGVDDGEGNPCTRYLSRLEIVRELIHKLPRSSWQCIRCHGGTPDVIPFQEQSFRTYVQFTYVIPPGPPSEIWQRMRDKTRNVIRRAEEQFVVAEIADPGEFVHYYEKNLLEKKMRNKLDLTACRRLIVAAQKRHQGRVVGARNAKGEMVAANFCAWDGKTSYYIACTRSDAAGNGAASLLVWNAIQHAAKRELTFDFAGLGTPGSVLHYVGFGGVIQPRFTAVRASGLGRLIAGVRSLFVEDHFLF